MLYRQGDEGNSFYIIYRGAVDIYIKTSKTISVPNLNRSGPNSDRSGPNTDRSGPNFDRSGGVVGDDMKHIVKLHKGEKFCQVRGFHT